MNYTKEAQSMALTIEMGTTSTFGIVNMIKQALEGAALVERDRCAKICEDHTAMEPDDLAAAIRSGV